MKRDTFYFAHDYNANNDVKILFLRQQLGMEGYGIYWFLIESLADAGGLLPVKLISVLSMQMHTNEVKVNAVISNFDLFKIVNDYFYSERLIEHLEIRRNLSDAGKLGAKKRWDKVINGGAIGGANAKERKGKEIKGKEIKEIITNGKKFVSTDFKELPDHYGVSIIQQSLIQKQLVIDKNQVISMWEIFKIQNLTGDNWYNNENEVYKHFTNWLKNQKFETNGKSIAEKRIDAMQEYITRSI